MTAARRPRTRRWVPPEAGSIIRMVFPFAAAADCTAALVGSTWPATFAALLIITSLVVSGVE